MAEMILLNTLLGLLLVIALVCIIIAPLFIWRNSMRMVNLLILLAKKQGIANDDIRKALFNKTPHPK